MAILTGFVAYPGKPSSIGHTIRAALGVLRADRTAPQLTSWEENEVAGHFLTESILPKIDESRMLVADITRMNFNVVFEVGYAIGMRKHVHLIRNAAIVPNDELMRDIGVFDTIGYDEYTNSTELVDALRVADPREIPFDGQLINQGAPIYILLPRAKTRLLSRIKKSRLQFRSFDPEEQSRLSAMEAIENVAESHGIVVPFLPRDRKESDAHNMRGAFVAGISLALGRETLLLQEGEDPIPLDYRDFVSSFRFPDQIDQHVADFSINIGARFQASSPPVVSEPRTFLERLSLGASAAENELQELGYYYLETDEYRRALRGEIRIVTGRKGAGKTALFAQLRDKLRQDRSRVVLDLKPEGFQLIKLRERVLDYMEEGTREHTITAFWEYLLLLETTHKILEKDKQLHMRDGRLFEPYTALAQTYFEEEHASEGDFSERMLGLMQRIADDFDARRTRGSKELRLSSGEITELLHKHDVAKLRERVVDYLEFKKGLWVLFDNLDKGWPAHGVTSEDVRTLRALIEAMAKIERALQKREIDCHGVVFIRNDVFELLVANTADRGKIASVTLDWTDPDLLRELLRRRFVFTGVEGDPSFESIWRQIAETHIRGEESSQYLIERSLMRPRALIELLRSCRSRAVNLGHPRIEVADFEQGEEVYSSALLDNIGYEIRDVDPDAGDLLYEFIGARALLSGEEVRSLLLSRFGEEHWPRMLNLLLWYGFLGLVRDDTETSYIFSLKYDMRRLNALIEKKGLENTRFRINPAFWRALEVAQ